MQFGILILGLILRGNNRDVKKDPGTAWRFLKNDGFRDEGGDLMDKKAKKEKTESKDRESNNCCYYVFDPCGSYMVDPCGCRYVNPCCC